MYWHFSKVFISIQDFANLLTWIILEMYGGSNRSMLVTLGYWGQFAKRNGPQLNHSAASCF